MEKGVLLISADFKRSLGRSVGQKVKVEARKTVTIIYKEKLSLKDKFKNLPDLQENGDEKNVPLYIFQLAAFGFCHQDHLCTYVQSYLSVKRSIVYAMITSSCENIVHVL